MASSTTTSFPPSCSPKSSLPMNDSPPVSPTEFQNSRSKLKITRTFRTGESDIETLTPGHNKGIEDKELYRTRCRVTLSWPDGVRTVLVVATPHLKQAVLRVPKICEYLVKEMGLKVYIDKKLKKKLEQFDKTFKINHLIDNSSSYYYYDEKDLIYNSYGNLLENRIDFIISLGGDGLILHISSQLFPKSIPPIMPYHMGSMGFLTPFYFKDYRHDISSILSGKNNTVTLRMRLQCSIHRLGLNDSFEKNNNMNSNKKKKNSKIRSPLVRNFTNNELHEKEHDPDCELKEEYHVLNELVIDRGPAPYLSNLQVLCDDCPVTRVHADGLIIGTPTGSTAYSLSSGGSMVHPSVPTILFTPICPHSLSFRPVLFPSYVTLQVKVPKDARASAWASFDGRHRVELQRGDSVSIKVSPWSVPTFTKKDTTKDWFASVSNCLRWNERVLQKPLEVDEDDETDDISIIELTEQFSLK